MSLQSFYEQASIKVREQMASKVTGGLNKNLRDDARRFVKLTNEVPNWKTYLTPKQLDVAEPYLKLLSSTEVDYQLGLTEGTTYHRMFGTPSRKTANGNEGAYGTLKRVSVLLKQQAKEKALKKAK